MREATGRTAKERLYEHLEMHAKTEEEQEKKQKKTN